MALLHPAVHPAVRAPELLLVIDRDAPARDRDGGHGAVTLAALAMDPDERRRFDAALDELGDRLELRANPLASDLSDGAPDDRLRRLLPAALPKLTAAEALLASSWRGSAGGFVVRAVATCPPRAECVDPRARGGDADSRRARFLAWPLSSAARLEFSDAAAAAEAATRLRRQAAAPDSHIALVLGGAPSPVADLPSLRAHAARVARRLRQAHADTQLIERLLDATPAVLPSSLLPSPTQLVIVPRLGSLARLPELTREIETVVPHPSWQQRPLPLD